MNASCALLVIAAYLQSHRDFSAYVHKLSDAQLHWRPAGGVHSIAWHVWHVARWADCTQADLPTLTAELNNRLGRRLQIWHSESWATRWRFEPTQLGYAETGLHMTATAVSQLRFPPKADLFDYLEKAFIAVGDVLQAVDDRQFHTADLLQPLTGGIWEEKSLGDALLQQVIHDSRHLGMMETLLGQQGQPGTATE